MSVPRRMPPSNVYLDVTVGGLDDLGQHLDGGEGGVEVAGAVVGDDDGFGPVVGGVASVLADHNALDDHGQALGGGQPVDVGPRRAGVADVHRAGRGVGSETPGVLGQVDLVVVGRGRADVVIADVALALGLDLGVDGDAEGSVAGLGGAGGHLEGQAAVLEQVTAGTTAARRRRWPRPPWCGRRGS